MMPSYDTLEDTASYHGTRIKTPPPSQLYKDNYDRIFGKKEEERPLTDDDVDGKTE